MRYDKNFVSFFIQGVEMGLFLAGHDTDKESFEYDDLEFANLVRAMYRDNLMQDDAKRAFKFMRKRLPVYKESFAKTKASKRLKDKLTWDNVMLFSEDGERAFIDDASKYSEFEVYKMVLDYHEEVNGILQDAPTPDCISIDVGVWVEEDDMQYFRKDPINGKESYFIQLA